ncbi:MAG: beta-ketoacyl synthase N-terminal-like domain-containing protein [Candidatus Brocadiaceae bacterium]
MERLVITGIGPLTPMGTGKEQFWDALKNGCTGIKRINRFSSNIGYYGGEIGNLNFDEYFPHGKFRRAAEISKYTIVAIKLAMDDANASALDRKKTGIIAGLTLGALNYTQSYHKLLITEGVASASPILFSDSLLNAPAGNASLSFGVNGPVHTLIGGKTTAAKSIMLASQIIALRTIDKAIVVSAEELNELLCLTYLRLGLDTLSEGAGALVLEKENTMIGSPYCYLKGISSHINPSNPQTALCETMEKSLKMADMGIKDIDLVVMDSPLPEMQELRLSGIPIVCITPFTGNAFALSSVWNIIVSALIIRYGMIPPSIVHTRNIEVPFDKVNNIMIAIIENEGSAASMILSKYS